MGNSIFCCYHEYSSEYTMLVSVSKQFKNLRIYFTESEESPSPIIIQIYIINDSAPFPFLSPAAINTIIAYSSDKGSQGQSYLKSELFEALKRSYTNNARWIKVPEPKTQDKQLIYSIYKMVIQVLMSFSASLRENNQHLNVTLMWPAIRSKKNEQIIKNVIFERIRQNKHRI